MVIRLLVASCGVWYWHICRGSFGSWMLGRRGPPLIRLVLARSTGARSDWGSGESGCLGLLVKSLEPFLSSFCDVVCHSVLLVGQMLSIRECRCHGGVLGPQRCLDGWCTSSGTHMNAKIEHCIVQKQVNTETSTFVRRTPTAIEAVSHNSTAEG